MDDISGGDARGESDRIAPVIPLFGRSGSDASRGSSGTGGSSTAGGSSGDDAPWASTWHPSSGQRPDRAEEQVRDSASRARLDAMGSPSDRHPARSAARTQPPADVLRALPSSAEEDGDEAAADLEQVRAAAEEAL